MMSPNKCLLAAVLVALLIVPTSANDAKSIPKFIKGYSWGWVGSRGEYLGEKPAKSLASLSATGTEWLALCFAAHMDTRSSAKIRYSDGNDFMVSDEEIRRAIRVARENEMKVIMKAVVNCQDGAWRAEIGFDSESDWEKWWGDYEEFLCHYARIAAETKCEIFSVGCEMRSTEGSAHQWRRVIGEVRKVYPGLITYNSNHGDLERVSWFDAVDVIGVSAYYPVGSKDDTSLEHMLAAWKPVREKLRRVSRRWNRPILFMEIGMRSAKTCSSMPWDWGHTDLPYDGQEQARYYEAAFQTFWNEPWFVGYCWWDWKAQLYPREEAQENRDFCIYGKPAEEVLRTWYSKAR